jgi:CDP-4-dehydro-6-deoxyglucose reductase, E1
MEKNNDFLENETVDKSQQSKELRKKILDLVAEYTKNTHKKNAFIPNKSVISTSGKTFGELELQMLVSSSLDFWLTAGRFNSEFEKQLANFLEINTAVTTNSGSSANLLAITSLTSKELGENALNPNDEIITVAAGFPTTVNPIIQNGLVPVFVDIEIPTYAINYKQIENAITDKTKAIMVAHTLGNPFNLSEVTKIAKKHNLWLIEDCCDALGSTYDNKFVGSFGDLATLSFYPAHQITMGEGGAVLTNNHHLKKLVESFRDWGRDCFCAPGVNNTCGKRFEWQLGELPAGYDHKYTYSNLGYNLKVTDMQAAVGLAQLQRLPEFVKKRKENFKFLKEQLEQVNDVLILPEATVNSDPSWFGFPITVKEESSISREQLLFHLTRFKIDTRPIFAGNLTKQPYFKNIKFRKAVELKNTDIVMNQSFWIGVHPGLTEEMLEYVSEKIISFVNLNRN